MAWPVVHQAEVAWIGANGMREIDRVMVDELGVSLLQMMENAGRWLAEVIRVEHGPGTRVVVVAGGGGNGGGGLAAGRHLVNADIEVRVELVADPHRLGPAAAHQLGILQQMGVPVGTARGEASFHDVDVIIDAMVGYSLRGPLRGVPAEVCAAMATANAAVVSLDLPSGTAADGDGAQRISVRADTTLTLCLPKHGLRDNESTGRLMLADISVPSSVVATVTDGPPPPFRWGPILELSAGLGSSGSRATNAPAEA